MPTARTSPTALRQRWVLVAVAVGGAAGATARYGVSLLWPTADGGLPWTTAAVNVVGSLLLGVLVAVVDRPWRRATETTDQPREQRRQRWWQRWQALARPALGVGVLGGFTTFSTAAWEIGRLLDHGWVLPALLALALTPLVCVLAAALGATGTRALLRGRRP